MPTINLVQCSFLTPNNFTPLLHEDLMPLAAMLFPSLRFMSQFKQFTDHSNRIEPKLNGSSRRAHFITEDRRPPPAGSNCPSSGALFTLVRRQYDALQGYQSPYTNVRGPSAVRRVFIAYGCAMPSITRRLTTQCINVDELV